MQALLLKTSIFTLSLSVILFNTNIYADGGATRSPINPEGEVATVVSVPDGGIIDLNSTRDVVNTNAGYSSITSINIDTNNGVIRGYAQYGLDENRTYATPSDVGGSIVSGTLSLDTSLVGPANPAAPDTVDVTVLLDFDGSFLINSGTPTLLLSANLVATTIDSSIPLSGSIYQSNLIFLSSALSTPEEPVNTTFSGSQSPLGIGEIIDFDGAIAEILSEELDDLHAVLSLTIPVAVGEILTLNSIVFASATASPDPKNDADISSDIMVLAAEGAVDFSNTARLQILLPEGYSLDGDDPLLDNIVHTSAVPLPMSIWMLLSGLISLAGFKYSSAKRLISIS